MSGTSRIRAWLWAAMAGLAAIGPVAAHAQVTSVDPNTVIDADLDTPPPPPPSTTTAGGWTTEGLATDEEAGAVAEASAAGTLPDGAAATNPDITVDAAPRTYQRDDVIGAAEGVFGRGAEGLARIIEDILRDQGEPNGYIVGRELGGSFIFGLRYGSGTLHHRVEGEMPTYWTGPSAGFDFGANTASTFVLVYNLHDTDDLYRRFPAGEGAAYLVGGFNASYMRRGDVVLIPIRLGVGARVGVNVGYMKFSRQQRWLPF